MSDFSALTATRLADEMAEVAPRGTTPGFKKLFAETAEQLRAAVVEVERLRNRVLQPLTEGEIKRALHEGRAEAMAATGDNAWSTLLMDRDRLSARLAEVERLCEEAIGELGAASRWIGSTQYRVDDETYKQFAAHIEQAARELRAALSKKETP